MENLIFYFAIYSMLGWVAQGIYVGFKKRHFVNTGFLYGPYVPIYGFGALITLYLVDPFAHHWWSIFLLTFFLCSVLEYVTSWAMEKLFHRLWWNYKNRPFNIHGRVCLLNSTLYGIGGVLISKVTQPLVAEWARVMDPGRVRLFDILFLLIFGTDLVCTLVHMADRKKALEAIHAHVQELKQVVHARPIEEIHQSLQANLKKIASDRHLEAFPNMQLSGKFQEAVDTAKAHLNMK